MNLRINKGQFNNFELNLTYPQGHQKEYTTLHKALIIGASGTGKTTILEHIKLDCDFHDRKYIYFSSDFLAKYEYHSDKLILTTKQFNDFVGNKRNFDFGCERQTILWDVILFEFLNYMKNLGKLYSDLGIFKFGKGFENNNRVESIETQIKNLSENSPLIKIKNALNPLLEKYFLRVVENPLHLDFIMLETLKGEYLPFDKWSTGVKRIIGFVLPLCLLDTENTFVLIDDIGNFLDFETKKHLIQTFTEIAPNAHFIFTTNDHDVALKFSYCEKVFINRNEDGYVYANYYNKAFIKNNMPPYST